jgi:undecaprenyl-diphosphatase
MDSLQALFLGLIQGFTEYLPVSSSGHLAIASHFFGLEDGEQCLSFTIAVHVATVLSTLVVLFQEVVWLLKGLFRPVRTPLSYEQKYILNIIVSMIPIGIVGVCFKDAIEDFFGGGLLVIGICLVVTAILLTFSYYARPNRKEEISTKDAFIIGLAQAVAVLPGLSRSGSTIATGLLLGNNKAKLAQFSFLMVIPPILGEALLDALKMLKGGAEAGMSVPFVPMAIGFVAAFVSGCIACKWMINLVKKGKLIYFGIYCAVVGAILIVTSLI